jgi:hypothetical protein
VYVTPFEARGLRVEFTPNFKLENGMFDFKGCFYTFSFDFEYKPVNPRTKTYLAMMDLENSVVTMNDGLGNYHH